MLTSRNDDLRWILATIVESGNRRFWAWMNCDKLCFHGASFVLRDVFLASIFVAYVEPKLFFTFAQENSPVGPTQVGTNGGNTIIFIFLKLFQLSGPA